jgi:hypothetical protein
MKIPAVPQVVLRCQALWTAGRARGGKVSTVPLENWGVLSEHSSYRCGGEAWAAGLGSGHTHAFGQAFGIVHLSIIQLALRVGLRPIEIDKCGLIERGPEQLCPSPRTITEPLKRHQTSYLTPSTRRATDPAPPSLSQRTSSAQSPPLSPIPLLHATIRAAIDDVYAS